MSTGISHEKFQKLGPKIFAQYLLNIAFKFTAVIIQKTQKSDSSLVSSFLKVFESMWKMPFKIQ